MKIISINPSNNEILGEVEETTKEEVIEKIGRASCRERVSDNV